MTCTVSTGLEVAYVGDATNVTRSLAVALLRLGRERRRRRARRATSLPPEGAEDPTSVARAGHRCDSPIRAGDAVKGADVVYTDAWVSMGVENARPRNDVATSPPSGSTAPAHGARQEARGADALSARASWRRDHQRGARQRAVARVAPSVSPSFSDDRRFTLDQRGEQ